MELSENVPDADTLAIMVDEQIGEIVKSAPEEALRSDDTPAGDGSLLPLEAAILSIDHDIRTALRVVGEIKRQAEAFETFARSLSTDMQEIKAILKRR
jgi:hypothetical protein